MDKQLFFEILGYVASVVTAFSLTMKNIRRLRWWNLIGAAVFSTYGALIGAWPVCAMNGFVVLVDIYYLINMNRHREYFDLMEVDIHRSDLVKRYLEFYKEDIKEFFPDFNLQSSRAYRACFCLRDARPVSLIVFSEQDKDEIRVELDYVIPEYRDLKNGKYFYHEGLRKLGLDHGQTFISKNANPSHQKYLKTLGFVKSGEENGIPVYRKQ